MQKLNALLKKYRNILVYMFFGTLTTVVDYAVYFPCYNLLGFPAAICNILAWTVSVLFAFVTNKRFVFHSHGWSRAVVWPELVRFVGCRAGSGLMETGVISLTVDLLGWNGNWIKLAVSMLVVGINYFASKLLVFRNRRRD